MVTAMYFRPLGEQPPIVRKALQQAHECRRFGINDFSRRATCFLASQGFIFAGFGILVSQSPNARQAALTAIVCGVEVLH